MGIFWFIDAVVEITMWSVCNIGHEFNTLESYISSIDANWYHYVVLGLN